VVPICCCLLELLRPGTALKDQIIYLLKFMTMMIRMTRMMMMMIMKYMMTTRRSRWRQKGRQRRNKKGI
jgi:hypothetical protein